MMQWQRTTALAVLLTALVALAAWQWDEYGHECELICGTVANSAESVMNALVGGVQSHRRLGPFFAEQVQDVLDGLANSDGVLAVALAASDGKTVLSAGKRELLDLTPPLKNIAKRLPGGFQQTQVFSLPEQRSGPGAGRGGGMGGGQGWGRQRQSEEALADSPWTPGSSVTAALLLDCCRADAACRKAAWTRLSIVLAGWTLVVCAGIAWHTTVRLTEASGRVKMFEAEARHFRELSQAAAGLAHETRNPLGLIRGWTQRFADRAATQPEHRKEAQTVIEECDRLTARLNQFLAFARPAEPKQERFDLSVLTSELSHLLEPDLEMKHLTLKGVAPGHTVAADREMLREALFNLLQNAVQASEEHGEIETSIVAGRHGQWRIEVADRGKGIPPDLVSKLFTPYFTTRSGGAGLGLAIVRRVAAAHGWEAGYSPRSGSGAIFWLDGIHG
jgi:signal transduction histidine kinase